MSTLASPASNGGRGLKLDLREALIRDRAASPASNGGRGLKPWNQAGLERGGGIARQQWRARIETPASCAPRPGPRASPASNGGRGLKPPGCGRSTSALPHRPPAMAGAD